MKMKFRISPLFLSLILLFTSFSTIAYGADKASEPVLGDVDRSGAVDTQDAREILKMAAGIVEEVSVADMNRDGVVSVEDAIQALVKATNIDSSVVIPDKNGENYLSDDPDNEFIKLIVSTYNVDAKSLVAIYSVPDCGANYVLQFKKNSDGSSYKKSPDTLYRVYHISVAPERTISYTSGNLFTGNHNCSSAEGIIVFNLIKTQVMKQYPDYFEGV